MLASPRRQSSDLARDHYSSNNAFKYYSIIQSPDYSGIGIYPSEREEIDPEGRTYARGAGVDSVREANILRDQKTCNLLLKYGPADHKLRVVDMGGGRGGLARMAANMLKKAGRLEHMMVSNISEKENEYNREVALKEGLSEKEYSVITDSFHDMDHPPESFDVIVSNEAFLHSDHKEELFKKLAIYLKKGGVLIFSDIIESEKATREDLQEVYDRLNLDSLGTYELYDRVLTENGLTKVMADISSRGILLHYGMVKYCATIKLRDELLAHGNCTEEFVNKQVYGLGRWIENAKAGLVLWGWFVYRKPWVSFANCD